MVLQRDFRRVFNLLRRAAEHGTQSCGGHRGGRSDLGLTARFGTRDRRIEFNQTANRSGCQ